MALGAGAPREGRQQLGVVGAVRPMALHTALACEADYRIVLVDERSRDIAVARDAQLAAAQPRPCGGQLHVGAPRVDLVAVAADQPALRYGMVEVMPELVRLF